MGGDFFGKRFKDISDVISIIDSATITTFEITTMIIIMFLRPPLALPRGAPPPAASTAWRQKVSSVGVIEATGNLKKANPYHHNHHYPCYKSSFSSGPAIKPILGEPVGKALRLHGGLVQVAKELQSELFS